MRTRNRILLVEDTPDDEVLALRALAKSNIAADSVTVVRNGIQALEYLGIAGKTTPGIDTPSPTLGLILLDMKLPGRGGLEVLRGIRAHELTQHLPVVILTSSNEPRDITDAYRGYANSYIRKPINFDEFTQAIRQIVTYWLDLNILPDETGIL